MTIGCRIRWPIEPTGPAIFTSAAHFIAVTPAPASLRSNEVTMFMIAPTPSPFAASSACSGSRSASFSKLIFMRSPPRPSGILTFAVQWVSSCTAKLSTPGMVFAIRRGC